MTKLKSLKLFSVYQDLSFELVEDEEFNFKYNERWFSPIDRTLKKRIKIKI